MIIRAYSWVKKDYESFDTNKESFFDDVWSYTASTHNVRIKLYPTDVDKANPDPPSIVLDYQQFRLLVETFTGRKI